MRQVILTLLFSTAVFAVSTSETPLFGNGARTSPYFGSGAGVAGPTE